MGREVSDQKCVWYVCHPNEVEQFASSLLVLCKSVGERKKANEWQTQDDIQMRRRKETWLNSSLKIKGQERTKWKDEQKMCWKNESLKNQQLFLFSSKERKPETKNRSWLCHPSSVITLNTSHNLHQKVMVKDYFLPTKYQSLRCSNTRFELQIGVDGNSVTGFLSAGRRRERDMNWWISEADDSHHRHPLSSAFYETRH